MSVQWQWDHFVIWLITIVAVAAYQGVRIWYLATGKSRDLGQEGVNIPFSWMTLIAEGALASLGIYLNQNFWKQNVDFSELTPNAMDHIHKVPLVLAMCTCCVVRGWWKQ